MTKPAPSRAPSGTSRLSPLMSQYWSVKNQYPDALLFFRVGDFYETFYEDAKVVSRLLGIALTTRDKGKEDAVPLAGVPFHAVDGYIARLVKQGRKVAVCEQVEDPTQAKGLVRRAVTEVVTPGTALSPQVLEEKENQFCLAIAPGAETWGFSLLDLSTGEFLAGEAPPETIALELGPLPVREVMLPEGSEVRLEDWLGRMWEEVTRTSLGAYLFDPEVSQGTLLDHFGVRTLEGFGLADGSRAAAASGALLRHLEGLREKGLVHVRTIRPWGRGEALALDDETIANLELIRPLRGSPPEATLVHQLDRTLTAAGGRLLRRWIVGPLGTPERIVERLDAVEELTRDGFARDEIAALLRGFGDLERLLGRVVSGRPNPRDLKAMGEAARRVPDLRARLEGCAAPLLLALREEMDDLAELETLVAGALTDDPPAHLREGGAIRAGYDEELDRLVREEEEAKRWIAGLQESERARTGIPTLKIGFNKVFGYYLEITRTHKEKVPGDYIRKQTLVNAERYVTPELKEKEAILLAGESRRVRLEQTIYEELCRRVAAMSDDVQCTARAVARLDVLLALARVALANGYVRPDVDGTDVVRIRGGRHPVLERLLPESFVPNDLLMSDGDGRLLLITGPNMAGKSTYLRQCALIFVMAQMGSFVPAEEAVLGVADRIFTRVGAQDHLSAGRSTFLVEMTETANILNNCTDRSFVILDEIGRGTSTYDGLSIAWAVAEHLVGTKSAHPRALFATHYHELTALSDRYPLMKTYRMEVREWEDQVLFLHRVVPGAADRSYGIHVARLAGLPAEVLSRAREILETLEAGESVRGEERPARPPREPTRQIGLFEARAPDPLRGELEEIDPERITPLEAHRILAELVKKARR